MAIGYNWKEGSWVTASWATTAWRAISTFAAGLLTRTHIIAAEDRTQGVK